MLPQLFYNPKEPRFASGNGDMGYFFQFMIRETVPIFFHKKVIFFGGKDGLVFTEPDDGWFFEYGNRMGGFVFDVVSF